MDAVEQAFANMRWHYAAGAPEARAEFVRRIRERARRGATISYPELVDGVEIQLPNVHGGAPFYLGNPEWTDLDRAILGELLGYISMESYREAGIIASSVVVSSTTREPSEGFRVMMRQLGKLRSGRADEALMMWSSELAKAQEWYANH
jgi:hypothetical protein